MIADVKLLLGKNKPSTNENGDGLILVSNPAVKSYLNNPSLEAAERDARLKEYRRSGDPYLGNGRNYYEHH
jgi:hypothetical protein